MRLFLSFCGFLIGAATSYGTPINVDGIYHPERSACMSFAKTDAEAEREVKACYEEAPRVYFEDYEKAPQVYLAYRRDQFAHDNDLLIFWERRQLSGWEGGLKSYFDLIATLPPVISSTTRGEENYSNMRVKVRGDLAFIAANVEESEIDLASGGKDTDWMRETRVFERRNGRWVTVHAHASFQAPRGLHRPIPMITDPKAKLWDPRLTGSWKAEDGDGFMIASDTYVAIFNVSGLPSKASYRIPPKAERIELVSKTGDHPLVLEVDDFTASKLIFRIPGRSTRWKWQRVE